MPDSTSLWDRVPEELKSYYRRKNATEDEARMEAFKRKTAHLKFGTDVTGLDLTGTGESVKTNPPDSGFINEPDVYDDFAYSRPVDPPKVIIALNKDNEVVTSVVMLDAFGEEEHID